MKKVNLISGGMDSFLTWWIFCRNAVNVYVKINHKYQEKELKVIENIKKKFPEFKLMIHEGSDIGKFEDEKSGIIPNRNAELILSASQYGNEIYFGVIANEINSDKSPEFIKSITDVLNISNRKQYWTEGTNFQIKTPVKGYTKSELVKLFLDKGGTKEILDLTVSCYSKNEGHCGACPSCFKRFVSYVNNGLKFESVFNPIKWAEENNIFAKCLDGTYNEERSMEILSAMKKLNYNLIKK